MFKSTSSKLLLAFVLVAPAVQAATITNTFQVSANVIATCQNLTSTNLNFGNYDPFNATDKTGNSTITVTCTTATNYNIALDSGSSGSFTARTMQNGPNNLVYNLFTDAALTTIWGDGTNGTNRVPGGGNGTPVNTTVFGKINAGQNAAAGSYSDTITVTVEF